MLDIVSPAIVIALVAIGMALVSKALQWKFTDKEAQKKHQEKIKENQKIFNELIKEADKNKKEIDRIQTDMLDIQSKMMNDQLKLSLISMPIFLIVFFALSEAYKGITFDSLFVLPLFHNFSIVNPLSWMPVGIGIQTGFLKAYIFYSLIANIILGWIEGTFLEKKLMEMKRNKVF